jgi:DNA processing protein
MNTAEIAAWQWLARLPRIPAATLRTAADRAGGPQALQAALCSGRSPLQLPARAQAALSTSPVAVEPTLRWLDAPARRLLVFGDSDYPPLLAATRDAPLLLHVRGSVDALHLPGLAIVGSRGPSGTGRDIARRFAAEFATGGIVVTSGLALGIDAAAHRGALAAGGPTIAVFGTGPDCIYPAEHATLAEEIATRGAIVSEFAPGTLPRAANFPRRNRIISGLSLGVLVVEAAERSGSLITARLAGEQGRGVFAVPGSILNPLARGCHKLIRDGAQLVEAAAEVVRALDFGLVATAPAGRAQVPATHEVSAQRLDTAREMLLNALGFEPVDLDTLVERTGHRAEALASRLLLLELEGEVESRGGRYSRVPSGRSS